MVNVVHEELEACPPLSYGASLPER